MPEDFSLLEAEQKLRERFADRRAPRRAFPSDAKPDRESRVVEIALPDELRAPMPLTKEKFLVRENPTLVMWERESRKFLRNLSVEHEHRVTAIMIYEWVTGSSIKELSGANHEDLSRAQKTWRADLRKINRILVYYFGKPYMTWIAGRKVPKAYTVRKGYYIKRHRPLTLTLYAEYCEGSLIA